MSQPRAVPPPSLSLILHIGASPRPSCQLLPEAGLSILRRAYPSRGGSIHPKAGLSVLRRAYPSRGGHIRPEAGLSAPTRAYPRPFRRRPTPCPLVVATLPRNLTSGPECDPKGSMAFLQNKSRCSPMLEARRT
ncbi:hypothetical protein T484DRAFT_3648188 [Baffinella frigidus]|nr:hypothetical protein T484DRAFT_3648188 [Cryptophyta sp. CCMP2293]